MSETTRTSSKTRSRTSTDAAPHGRARTRYADAPPWAARVLLAAVVVLTFVAVRAERDVYRDYAPPRVTGGPGASDWDYYRAIARRLRGGEAYHDALEAELLRYGQPSSRVFNWRPPFHLWAVTRPGGAVVARLALAAAGLAAAWLGWRVLRRSAGPVVAGVGVAALAFAYAPMPAADVYLLSEVCAGGMLTLSLLLLADRRPVAGLAAGALALFLRELSAPFFAVAALCRLSPRRRAESAAWLVIGVGWLAYLALHAAAVKARVGEAAAGAAFWSDGGLAFALSTLERHPLLVLIPGPARAALAPALLLGIAGLRGRDARALRLTALLYPAAFLAVGRYSNAYWGNLYAPLMSLGMALAVPSLVDLARAAVRPRGAASP